MSSPSPSLASAVAPPPDPQEQPDLQQSPTVMTQTLSYSAKRRRNVSYALGTAPGSRTTPQMPVATLASANTIRTKNQAATASGCVV